MKKRQSFRDVDYQLEQHQERQQRARKQQERRQQHANSNQPPKAHPAEFVSLGQAIERVTGRWSKE